MPNDPLTDLSQLVASGVIVAAVAVPVGLTAALWYRRTGNPLLPRWQRPPQFPRFGLTVEGFDFLFILLFCFIYAGLYPAFISGAEQALAGAGFFELVYGPSALSPDGPPNEDLRKLWGMAVVAPWFLVLWFAVRRVARPHVQAGSRPRFARDVALGVAAWLVVSPVVFLVHLVSNLVSQEFGSPPGRHPLSRLGVGQTPFDYFFFGTVVCLLTPIVEEVMFRGLLVGWATGRRYRPWLLMALAGGVAYLASLAPDVTMSPLVWVGALAAGLIAVRNAGAAWKRFPTRTAASVYSTAALFAAAHSTVWPTPVPLFVLGLGLGLVAARTGGVTACVVMHGLFNAVSFVFLLRGGTG